MVRRDTERHHAYSSEIFSKLKIFDIQGLLKEEDEFKAKRARDRVQRRRLIGVERKLRKFEFAL